MNYYRRFMGDYAAKTADLSLAEHGAYNVLLDTCYSTERPLPGSHDALYRLCRAMSKLEQAAVRSVADRFFPVGKDGLRRNPRASSEISKAQSTIEKQRESGVESAAKRWSTDGSTHTEAIQPPTSNLQPPSLQPPTTRGKPLAPDAARQPPKLNGHRIEFDLQTGLFQGITDEDELRWQDAYPAVPIPPAIAQAAAWLKANPANRKSNYERFLVNWFKRDQDKAARVAR